MSGKLPFFSFLKSHAQQTHYSSHVKILLVIFKTRYFEYFLSDYIQSKKYYYTLYPLACLASENEPHGFKSHDYLCHQEHSVNIMQN